MKIILYILSTTFIFTPLLIWLSLIISKPKDITYEDGSVSTVIYHDSYVSLGPLTSSPKTFAFLSIALWFILLATIMHSDYKKTSNPEVTENEQP